MAEDGTYKPRIGKLIAQACHAAVDVFLDRLFENSTLDLSYVEKYWFNNGKAKISVYVDTEEELLELYKKAKNQNIICALVKDSGKTEPNIKDCYTALAIGPDENKKIDQITGHLKLL